jgi:hypothetical protein
VEHIENSKWNEDENPAAARDLVCINSWRGPLVTIEISNTDHDDPKNNEIGRCINADGWLGGK